MIISIRDILQTLYFNSKYQVTTFDPIMKKVWNEITFKLSSFLICVFIFQLKMCCKQYVIFLNIYLQDIVDQVRNECHMREQMLMSALPGNLVSCHCFNFFQEIAFAMSDA